jgi:hypothetical protein
MNHAIGKSTKNTGNRHSNYKKYLFTIHFLFFKRFLKIHKDPRGNNIIAINRVRILLQFTFAKSVRLRRTLRWTLGDVRKKRHGTLKAI